MPPIFSSRFLAVAFLSLLISMSAEAGRRRAVPPRAGAAIAGDVAGTVLDSVTSQPVIGAKVSIGSRSDTTDASGAFLVKNATGFGEFIVQVERSGYVGVVVKVSPGASVNVLIRMPPTATVDVRTIDGATFELDFETVLFGFAVAFSGYQSAPYDDFCRADGSTVRIQREEIARIIGPAVLVSQAACCTARQVLAITLELRDGSRGEYFFIDSCAGYERIDVIGRNHVTAEYEYITFKNIAEVVFP